MRFTLLTLGIFVLLLSGIATECMANSKFNAQRSSRHADAQMAYKMSHSRDVAITLSGTTPLHNWTMSAHGLMGGAEMTLCPDNRLLYITALTFSLPVRNLKGQSAGMDNDSYKALKADRYPEIVFQLTSATIEPLGDHRYVITALGNLTVAGIMRAVSMTMDAQIVSDGSIIFTGAQKLKMSDYNVERPSILFGALRAGDEMTLTYTLIFIK